VLGVNVCGHDSWGIGLVVSAFSIVKLFDGLCSGSFETPNAESFFYGKHFIKLKISGPITSGYGSSTKMLDKGI
jgi:hypothetical protein